MIDMESLAEQQEFRLIEHESIAEIEGEAYRFIHESSGARLLYLKNDDNNKAFSISFKTPPKDNTGVFHILEHSVLCGSDKFPVKEPFVNLLKTSMQTFLNAMTFPDKTMFPVASTNERDLLNLADVYLDAVFHPSIYRKQTIFEQEGWHIETTKTQPDGNQRGLIYNGVVFNEMKGELSNPDSLLYHYLSRLLFPDTAYGFESGGTPEAIPTLTYEEFLDQHARHYCPQNAYLILYGNLTIETFLTFLNEKYLAPLAQRCQATQDSGLSPFPKPNPLVHQKPLRRFGIREPMVTAPDQACAALGYVFGSAYDHERVIAVDILLDAIMGSNEAPMKRALLDAGIASDAQSYLVDAMLQPLAVIQLKGLHPEGGKRFREVVETCAQTLIEGGLDHELILAALSHAEFVIRERNYGMADGVALAISALAGWLYSDDLSTEYLKYEDIFKSLRQKLSQNYFETLIRELFLECPHAAEIEIVPIEEEEQDTQVVALEHLAQTLDDAQFRAIEDRVALLRAAQEEPDSVLALATLPRLSVADIGEAPAEPPYHLIESTPIPVIRHEVLTRGIVYISRYFAMDCLTFDELPYATVLSLVLGHLDTNRHSALEIDLMSQSLLGNLSCYCKLTETAESRDTFSVQFVLGTSLLRENLDQSLSLVQEVLLETDFSDRTKIYDRLMQQRVAMEQGFTTAGQSVAMGRVASYYLPSAVVREQLGGIDYYRFLCELTDSFNAKADELIDHLEGLVRSLFTNRNCVVSFAGDEKDYERFVKHGLLLDLPAETVNHAPKLSVPEPVVRNEAFIVPSDVSYSASGYDRRLLHVPFSGSWLVANRVLSFDYLWQEVRVKGGAYGAGFNASRTGNMRFYSYRDPHVDETMESFQNAGTWLSTFDPSTEELDGYVVSTTAAIDAPEKPRELVRRQAEQVFSHFSPEARLQLRSEVIATTVSDLRALGAVINEASDKGMKCAVGNRELLKASRERMELVELLS